VVTFHELAPSLTRIEVTLDVDPGSLIEKAARGMRHVKRAVRADLHRYKAFIEVQENETGAWRGVIEDGEMVEDHDPAYDEEHEYSDIEEIRAQAEGSEDEDEDEDDDGGAAAESDDDTQRGRTQRFKRQAETAQRSSRSRSSSNGRSTKSSSSGPKSSSSGPQTRAGSSSGAKRKAPSRS
jgi:hypothetical protein